MGLSDFARDAYSRRLWDFGHWSAQFDCDRTAAISDLGTKGQCPCASGSTVAVPPCSLRNEPDQNNNRNRKHS